MRNGVSEQELAESATGERVTLANVEAAITSEHYFTAAEGELGHRYVNNEDVFGVPNDLELLTICVLVLWNGFTVLGKSACADPANFDETIGRKIARQDAVNQIWPLMGFALKSRLVKERDSRPARITSAQPKVDSAKGAKKARLDTMEQHTTIGELRINTNPNNPTVLYFLTVTVNGQKFGHFLEVSKEELAVGTEVETQIVGKLLTVMGHGVLTGEWETPAIEPKKEDCASRLNRMKQELEEVSTRFKKLDDFLLGDSFASLPANDRQDLYSQHRFMEGYVGVLSRRVAKAGYSA